MKGGGGGGQCHALATEGPSQAIPPPPPPSRSTSYTMSYYDPDLAAPRAPTPAPVSRAKLYALVGTALCCMGAWLVTQGGPAGVATQRFRAVVPGVSPQTASYAASVTGLPVDDAGLAASSPTSGHRRGGGLLGVFGGLFGGGGERKYPIEGDEGLMSQKAHGTTEKAVQEDLRWGCDRQVPRHSAALRPAPRPPQTVPPPPPHTHTSPPPCVSTLSRHLYERRCSPSEHPFLGL